MTDINKEIAEAKTETSDTDTAFPEREIVFEEALEAILFAAGHPVAYSTLSRVFDNTPAELKKKVMDYATIYNNSDIPRGVILLTFTDSCQLCTKQYYITEIREALGIKKSGSLSTSSLEALAIVAYNQPVTRAFVDTLRRVDSSYAMNNLLDRGLIEIKGRLDAPGRPMLYGTTQDFLRCFGLKDLAELPATTDELMQVFDKAKVSAGDTTEAEQLSVDIDDLTEAVEENENQIEIEMEEPSADDNLDTE